MHIPIYNRWLEKVGPQFCFYNMCLDKQAIYVGTLFEVVVFSYLTMHLVAVFNFLSWRSIYSDLLLQIQLYGDVSVKHYLGLSY